MVLEAGTSERQEVIASIFGKVSSGDDEVPHQSNQQSDQALPPDADLVISEGFDLTERYDDENRSLLVYTDVLTGRAWNDHNRLASGSFFDVETDNTNNNSSSISIGRKTSKQKNSSNTNYVSNTTSSTNSCLGLPVQFDDRHHPNLNGSSSSSTGNREKEKEEGREEEGEEGRGEEREEGEEGEEEAREPEEEQVGTRRSSRISFMQIVERMTSDSFSARSTLSGLAPGPPGPGDYSKKENRASRNGNAMLLRSSNTLEFLTTFTGSTGMLQGAPVSLILSKGCRVFNSTARLEKERNMVHETEELDYFISHNWSVPRWQKYLALTFYFNFDVAAAAIVPLGVFISIACGLGWIPGSIPLSTPWDCSILFRTIGVPVFFIVLCFLRDVAALLRFRQRQAFLDCLCIDQTNTELKQQSIVRLGAFINSSHKMLVLYTDVYLHKLWTTYEVAAFCAVRKMKRMKVVPVGKASVFLITIFCAYLFGLGRLVIAALFPNVYKRAVGYIIAAIVYVYIVRRWKRWKLETRARIETFQLGDCICSDERDRPLVYSNIATLMRGVGKVSGLADQAEALRVFEKIVQTKLPDVFGAVSFRTNFKYRHYLFLGLISEGTITVDSFTGLSKENISLTNFVVYQAYFLFVWSAALPFAFVLGELVAHFFANLRGYREHIYLCLACLITLIIPGLVMNEGVLILVETATDSGAAASEDAALALIALPLFATPLVGRLVMAASGEWKIKFLAATDDDDAAVEEMTSSADGTIRISESQDPPTNRSDFEDQFFGDLHLQQSKV